MARYLQKRKSELLVRMRSDGKGTVETFGVGYDFISRSVMAKYTEVTPEMARRVELLEVLLFTFVEHVINLDSLSTIENELDCGSPLKDDFFH